MVNKLTLLTGTLCAGLAATLAAQNATIPGEVSTPYPTLTNLAVEWLIKGDDNRNTRVEVEYRMAGDDTWRRGMPLRRIPGGKSRDTRPIFFWENKFSGSLFDLRPATEYEIRLRLADPDGGKAEHSVRAVTRGVPRPAPDGEVKKVTPNTLERVALEARPGDILLLSPGYYEDFALRVDGEPGRPIVLRSDRAHPEINSTFDSIDLRRRKHVILEGLTVYGSVDLLGAEDIAVRYCKVNAKFGIIANDPPGCSNCYIADNEVNYVMPWTEMGLVGGLDGSAACVGEGGIIATGWSLEGLSAS